jgi:flagellar basal body-associated protein FliL
MFFGFWPLSPWMCKILHDMVPNCYSYKHIIIIIIIIIIILCILTMVGQARTGISIFEKFNV